MPKFNWLKLFFHIGLVYLAGNIFWSWYTCRDQMCVGDRGYYEVDSAGQYRQDSMGGRVPAEQ